MNNSEIDYRAGVNSLSILCVNRQVVIDLKNFFIVRVMEHCNRLPRVVVESSFLEMFKAYLYTYLGNLI